MNKMVVFVLLFLGGMTAHIEAKDSTRTPEERADRQVKKLTKELTLTDAQQTSVKAICLETAKQVDALKQDATLSKDDKRKKLVELQKSKDEKITALLTAEQKAKYDGLKAKRIEKAKKHKEKKKKAK